MSKRQLIRCHKLVRGLVDDSKAAVLPIFGVMVLLMIVIAGAAIDISRTVAAREKLSYALDAAGLALATELSTTTLKESDIIEILSSSFEANLANAEFLDEAIKNLKYEIDPENGIVSVSSTASLENYFLGMGGYSIKDIGPEVFEFGTAAQVSYSRYDVELALVLDVTGSMSSDMDTLRDASEGLVDILIPEGTDESDSKVRISLVPYSQGVNLGSYAGKVKGEAYGYADSSVCVTERQDYDDGSEEFKVKYTDNTYDYYDKVNPPPKDTFYGGGSNNCSRDSKMIPLTAERKTLVDAIKALEDNGGTAGQTGVVWGWNSLSPNYSEVWPSDSKPALYSDDDVLKFAIIMTDGDNNRYYDFVEQENKRYCSGWGWSRTCWNQTVDVYDWREKSESQSYSNNSSTDQRELCKAMKEAGIKIFGVYFGTNNSSAGSKNMQACASDGNYYQATSSSELIDAFSYIAKKIQLIHLSK
ncbi:Tad domain-containing protein [Roseibium sp. SCP14]|uniref:Tad domain-containing protein n=1 Tax=Roseibium sp. SCP14 TaxID=3141375 RepID=UPI00333BEA7E